MGIRGSGRELGLNPTFLGLGERKKMCREEARREGGLDQERRKWNWREVGGSKEYFGFGIGRT